jgi:hypothetical protein
MQTTAIKTELMDLEREYWQAMKDKDAKATDRLTDYPCIVAGAQGVMTLDAAHMSAMLDDGAWSIEDFDLGDDVQVRMLSDDVAILAYKVSENLTVEGKPVSLEAADASVWVRREGRWRCALHTESLTGDPFGRDRRAAH